jgi:hypothetical protein
VRLLDTAAPGTDLGTASKLVTLRGTGYISWPFTIPDGSALISESGKPFRFSQTTASGALDVFSPRTGALLRTEARWHRHLSRNAGIGGGFTQAVIWSDFSGSRLIVETPHGKTNEIGFLAGSSFTSLPHAAQGPLLSAVNAGGFQTSGGYVGFAW